MKLRQQFAQIKNQFFPRWDRQGTWKISSRSRRNVLGYCDSERHIIEIVVRHKDPDRRDKLLIHEICHAVADSGHGKKWQNRMEKAARRAEELGRIKLAKLIREEIGGYQEALPVHEEVYRDIANAVTANPNLTFQQIKSWLAQQYGLLVSEIPTKFKRAKVVFEEARRDALEQRAWKKS